MEFRVVKRNNFVYDIKCVHKKDIKCIHDGCLWRVHASKDSKPNIGKKPVPVDFIKNRKNWSVFVRNLIFEIWKEK
jgi:hypothetical protein